MAESPLLSIVIPCYNDGRFLREAIDSVEKCLPGSYELLIVDDGSTDRETIDVLAELKKEGYTIIRQDNEGVGSARNAGVRASRGAYILPCDADNKIRPAFIDRAVQVLQEDNSIGVVYGDMQYFGEHDFRARIPGFDINEMLFLNYIDACAMYRREVWEDNGGYDENMPGQGVEDWDFWLNAYTKGWSFEHIDEIAQDYRARKDSMLHNLKDGSNYERCKEYVFGKYPRLVKTHYDELASWEYHGRRFRERPFYTIFRLLLSGLFPRIHDRRYKRR